MLENGAAPPARHSHRRWKPVVGAVVVALAITTIPVVHNLADAEAAGPNTVYTFEGGGFGHSVGMSQFGAYGMSKQGHTWQDIMTHYFTGASVADADPEVLADPIWVNLTYERSSLNLIVRATGSGSPVDVRIKRSGETGSLTASVGDTIQVRHVGDGACRVTVGDEDLVSSSCKFNVDWDGMSAAHPTVAIEQGGCELIDWNSLGGTVSRPCRYAYGQLKIRHDNNSQTFNVSLRIDIEDYVLGISESPYYWGLSGGMEALKAQAVAARSYALHRAIKRGDPADRPWCWCHIYDTSIDQHYVGWGHLQPEWTEAVTATAGKVLTHPSATHGGRLIPIETFYSSSTFGRTENSEHGFTASVPYLRGVDDHWSQLPEVGNWAARWEVEFTGSQLAARLPGLSTVTGLEVAACSPSGAILEITFFGDGGPKTFTTRSLRGLLSIRSMQIIRVGSPLPTKPACKQGGGGEDPVEGGPVALAGFSFDDDEIEDSHGNGDGIAQCGETIEVFTTLQNEGEALTGVVADISTTDPNVSIVWNTSSGFPDIAAGGTSTNGGDWDLLIDPDADADEVSLDLTVNAANGGPWVVELAIPISCGTAGVEAGGIAFAGDAGGSPADDLAIAYEGSDGAPRLTVRDGQTGSVITNVLLAGLAFDVVDITTVPHFAGGDGPEIAVALRHSGNGLLRVVTIDPSTGDRLGVVHFGYTLTPVDLEAVPGFGGSAAPELVFAGTRADGKGRVIVKDAVDGTVLGKIGTGSDNDLIDVEPMANFARTNAAEIAVLVRRGTGKTVVLVRDASSRRTISKLPFGDVAGIDIEVLDNIGATPAADIALLATGSGGAFLTVKDGKDRSIVTGPVGVDAAGGPRDLAVIPGGKLAVLGVAGDGTITALVVQADGGSIVAGPQFPKAYSPVGVAGLTSGTPAVAVLGNAGDGTSRVTVKDAVTGGGIASIPIA